MLDLRRFPVSDGAGVKCCTFCTILDRKQNLEISNNGFFISGHVTPEDMEMSAIALHRMEALSDSCGTGLRSKTPSEEPKSRFWP